MGDIARALQCAASQQPGPVRELAARAAVSYGVARYTASRMVDRGELVADGSRPAVLSMPAAAPASLLPAVYADLHRAFWD